LLTGRYFDTGVSNRRKYNTLPLMKLQTISDDDESCPSDYERMDEGGQAAEEARPAVNTRQYTTGNNNIHDVSY